MSKAFAPALAIPHRYCVMEELRLTSWLTSSPPLPCFRMSASLSLLVAARDQVNIFTPDQLNESWISQLFQGMKRHCSEITMERLSYAFVVFNGGLGGGGAHQSLRHGWFHLRLWIGSCQHSAPCIQCDSASHGRCHPFLLADSSVFVKIPLVLVSAVPLVFVFAALYRSITGCSWTLVRHPPI